MPGQALLLMRLQDDVSIEDVGGALQKGVDQVLVGAGYQLFDDPGLCLGQDAYGIHVPTEVARDHTPGTGQTQHFQAVAVAVVAAVLF